MYYISRVLYLENDRGINIEILILFLVALVATDG